MESKLGIINCNTGFQPLVECWLGDCYRPDFFDYVENDNVKNVLRRITEETIEDLENIKEVLENYSVTVKRPRVFDFEHMYNVYKTGMECLDANLDIDIDLVLKKWPRFVDRQSAIDWVDSYDMYSYPGYLTVPPLFPRDEQIVINDTIYRLTRNNLFQHTNDFNTILEEAYRKPTINEHLKQMEYPATQASMEPLFNEIKENYRGKIIEDLPFANTNDAPSIVRLGDTIILDGLPVDMYKYFKERLKKN